MSAGRKINILFVIMQMEMGGSERLVLNLASRIDRQLFNPSVAWFFGEELLQEFVDLGIRLFRIPKKKRMDMSAIALLNRIVSEHEIDVVNAHHFMSLAYAFYGTKIANRRGLLYTEHSEWEIESVDWKWKAVGQLMLRQADGVVGVTPSVAGRLADVFRTKKDRTYTILNGVDLERFATRIGHRVALREEMGIGEGECVIGIVANLKVIKNHMLLLKAFRELTRMGQRAKLLVIGQGFEGDPENSEHALRSYVKNEGLDGRVLFLGYRSDIPKILSLLDFFCLTSHMEGLPISLIEAMAAGLPVIGTDVQGIRDVITPNETGILVAPDDVVSLRDALLRLMRDRDLRQRLGKVGQEKARSMYSLDRCVEEYEKLFIYAAHHSYCKPEAGRTAEA